MKSGGATDELSIEGDLPDGVAQFLALRPDLQFHNIGRPVLANHQDVEVPSPVGGRPARRELKRRLAEERSKNTGAVDRDRLHPREDVRFQAVLLLDITKDASFTLLDEKIDRLLGLARVGRLERQRVRLPNGPEALLRSFDGLSDTEREAQHVALDPSRAYPQPLDPAGECRWR